MIMNEDASADGKHNEQDDDKFSISHNATRKTPFTQLQVVNRRSLPSKTFDCVSSLRAQQGVNRRCQL